LPTDLDGNQISEEEYARRAAARAARQARTETEETTERMGYNSSRVENAYNSVSEPYGADKRRIREEVRESIKPSRQTPGQRFKGFIASAKNYTEKKTREYAPKAGKKVGSTAKTGFMNLVQNINEMERPPQRPPPRQYREPGNREDNRRPRREQRYQEPQPQYSQPYNMFGGVGLDVPGQNYNSMPGAGGSFINPNPYGIFGGQQKPRNDGPKKHKHHGKHHGRRKHMDRYR
jgi:hypothetical protein